MKDFEPISTKIQSPNGAMSIVPMANKSYSDPSLGRLITFDVRDAKSEFLHHVQTDAPADQPWAIGWHDDNTIVVTSDMVPPSAYVVGINSMVEQLRAPFADALMASALALEFQNTNSEGSDG